MLLPARLALPLPRPGFHRCDNQRQSGLFPNLLDELGTIHLGVCHALLDEIVARRASTETIQPVAGCCILALDLRTQACHLALIDGGAHACSSCGALSTAGLPSCPSLLRRWPSR